MKNQRFGSDQVRAVQVRPKGMHTIAPDTLCSEAGVGLVSEAWGDHCLIEADLMTTMPSQFSLGIMVSLVRALMEAQRMLTMNEMGRARYCV